MNPVSGRKVLPGSRWPRQLVLVSCTALGYIAHHLVNVLATPGPRRLTTGLAGHGTAHGSLLARRVDVGRSGGLGQTEDTLGGICQARDRKGLLHRRNVHGVVLGVGHALTQSERDRRKTGPIESLGDRAICVTMSWHSRPSSIILLVPPIWPGRAGPLTTASISTGLSSTPGRSAPLALARLLARLTLLARLPAGDLRADVVHVETPNALDDLPRPAGGSAPACAYTRIPSRGRP